jgi:hypothetical protein
LSCVDVTAGARLAGSVFVPAKATAAQSMKIGTSLLARPVSGKRKLVDASHYQTCFPQKLTFRSFQPFFRETVTRTPARLRANTRDASLPAPIGKHEDTGLQSLSGFGS